MMYFYKIANLMHDVSSDIAPVSIQNLFQKSRFSHSYSTRSATSGNFVIKPSRLEIQRKSFSRTGPAVWKCLEISFMRNKKKKQFNKELKLQLTNILRTEDDYIGVSEIINKMPLYKTN